MSLTIPILRMLTLILLQTNSGLFFYSTDGPVSEQSIAYIKEQMTDRCFVNIKQITDGSDAGELIKLGNINIIDLTEDDRLELGEQVQRLVSSSINKTFIYKPANVCSKFERKLAVSSMGNGSKIDDGLVPIYICESNDKNFQYRELAKEIRVLQLDERGTTRCRATGFNVIGSRQEIFLNELWESYNSKKCVKDCTTNKYRSTDIGSFVDKCENCYVCRDCLGETVPRPCPGDGGCVTKDADINLDIQILWIIAVSILTSVIFIVTGWTHPTYFREGLTGPTYISVIMNVLVAILWEMVSTPGTITEYSKQGPIYLCLATVISEHVMWSANLVALTSEFLKGPKRWFCFISPLVCAIYPIFIIMLSTKEELVDSCIVPRINICRIMQVILSVATIALFAWFHANKEGVKISRFTYLELVFKTATFVQEHLWPPVTASLKTPRQSLDSMVSRLCLIAIDMIFSVAKSYKKKKERCQAENETQQTADHGLSHQRIRRNTVGVDPLVDFTPHLRTTRPLSKQQSLVQDPLYMHRPINFGKYRAKKTERARPQEVSIETALDAPGAAESESREMDCSNDGTL